MFARLRFLVSNNIGYLAAFVLIALAITILVGVNLRPRTDALALGNPSAPRPVAEDEMPVGLPPVARPAVNEPSGAESIVTEIDYASLRPDPAMVARTHAALSCAAGRDIPVDPTLDTAATEFWKNETLFEGDLNRYVELIEKHRLAPKLKKFMRVGGIVVASMNTADPCVFGDVDMRTIFPPEEWEGIDSVGIAFFPVPGMSDQPVASFEVLLMDNDSE
ncbi:MAG: hypothetical protein ACUVSW_07205 [Roseiflexus sp.]